MRNLTDAHAHLGSPEELAARRAGGIRTLLCATQPADARALFALAEDGVLLRSAALHPWHAGTISVDDMMPYMEKCAVVGEIGLDSVWCDVPIEAQRAAFTAQLAYAQEAGKPVVLHTKGCEEEIARTLSKYTMRKLIHWYSCAQGLGDYICQGCYFSIGPDIAINPAVRQVAERVPLDRMLVETDGMGAVEWALGKKVAPEEVAGVLERSIRAIAQLRSIAPEALAQRISDNLDRFVGIA
ncbi:MAG: TatD family hydrolase [Clostridia bacterium]